MQKRRSVTALMVLMMAVGIVAVSTLGGHHGQSSARTHTSSTAVGPDTFFDL